MKKLRLNHKLFINNQGFSLIEILVALVLVAGIMAISVSTVFSNNQNLENEVKNLERAIAYVSDESSLRNTVTRVHLFLSKDPQEYSVEYGPSSQFVLPATSEDSINVLTKDEEEKKAKDAKNLNMKFGRITDFQDSNSTLKDSVKIQAIGSLQSKTLQSSGEASIYAFPSGEKDEVFIALAEEDSIATITTSAFSSKIVHNYYHLDKSNEKDNASALQAKTKELFEKWLQEKR
jgi:prepilin-type N-terminal cleavage/methylation domain-containing protein